MKKLHSVGNKENQLSLHLLTLLQDVRSTMLCQTLVEILNCFFVFLLLEVRVANPSQGPENRRRQMKINMVLHQNAMI